MNAEKFIRDATRGLSRRKRAAAQTELRSHLHERTNQLILLGKPLPSAQAQAMQELGAPGEIARGLRRTEQVHPLLSAAALTALAGLLLGFPAWLSWEGWRGAQAAAGLNRSAAELRSEGYLTLPELRRSLGEQGVTLAGFGRWPRLEATGLPSIPLNDAACPAPVAPGLVLPELRSNRLYAQPHSLPPCMAQAGWPLEVQPDSVRLRGKAVPYLPAPPSPSASAQVTPRQWQTFWQSVLYRPRVETLVGAGSSPFPLTGQSRPRRYRVDRPAHTPVLLLLRTEHRNADYLMAWVEQDGTVELPTLTREPGASSDLARPIVLFENAAAWRQAGPDVPAAIALPLSRNAADPIRLEALKLTPAE